MLHALVAETVTGPATATFQLGGAVTGCVAFSARFTDGQPCFYLATDGAGHYEAGIGTFHTGTPTTLSRDTVTENWQGATTKISFSGTIQVFNFLASDNAIYLDSTGVAQIRGAAKVTGALEVDGSVLFGTNNITLSAKDTGNTTRTIFNPLDGTNNTNILVGGGVSSPAGKFQVLNHSGATVLFSMDEGGNATIRTSLTMTNGGILLPNANALQAKDSTAVAQNMIFIDGSNNLDVQIPNASSAFRVLNHAGSVSLFQVDNSGNATHTGTLHVTGAVTLDSTISVPNNTAYYGKDTSGTPHPLLLLDASNDLTMWIPLSNAFRVVNTAFSLEVFKVDNIGNATVHNALSVGDSLTVGTTLFVAGNSVLEGNIATNGAITTSGSTGSTNSGFEYGPAGGGAYSAARNFGLVVGSSVNVLANAYDAYSDQRLKTDIKEITAEQGRAFVVTSKPSTFIKAGSFEAGFVAQDMIRAGYSHLITHYDYDGLPELVEDGLTSHADVALSMIYDQTIAYLAAAMKGAFGSIEAHLARIEALERRH